MYVNTEIYSQVTKFGALLMVFASPLGKEEAVQPFGKMTGDYGN